MNARDAIYNIDNYKSGIIYSTITNVRNVIGSMSLDEVLTGRDKINKELLTIVDKLTDSYGIKILSVEIKNIVPPAEIQQAMEKQMKAERDKRAAILQAEGQKQSAIEIAEGEKQSKILQAEAEKEANIKRAEGMREAQLLEAEGKARAIMEISEAEAQAIRLVNKAIIDSGTNEVVIALKQVEALTKIADSPSSKLVIPSESITSLGSIASVTEMLKMNKETKEN
jgi:regulator of protease activity HflC (stomatin/prohibitin superfamily)